MNISAETWVLIVITMLSAIFGLVVKRAHLADEWSKIIERLAIFSAVLLLALMWGVFLAQLEVIAQFDKSLPAEAMNLIVSLRKQLDSITSALLFLFLAMLALAGGCKGVRWFSRKWHADVSRPDDQATTANEHQKP